MQDSEINEIGTSLPLIRRHESGKPVLIQSEELSYLLELVLDESLRMVKARTGNFYFYNENGELQAIKDDEHPAENLEICRYCIENRTSIHINSRGENVQTFPSGRLGLEPLRLQFGKPTICTALNVQEGVLGAIIVRDPRYFDQFFEADFALIKSFAATFSLMLNNSRQWRETTEIFLGFKSSLLLLLENSNLIHKIRQSERTLNTVLEVSNLINSSRELREMIQAVLFSAKSVIRAENASLFLVDPKTGDLYFEVISGKEKTDLRGFRIPQGQGIVGICAQEKKSIVVNDAQSDPRLYKKVDEVSEKITRNLMASPLVVDDETIGVIEVMNTIDRAGFSESDMQVFESFSDSVAIALQRRRILDDLELTNKKLEQRLSEITCLHAIAGALVEATTIEDMFSRVLKIIRRHLGVGRVSILLYNEKTNALEIVAQESENGSAPDRDDESDEHIRTADGGSLSEYVFNTNQPLFIDDMNSSELQQFSNPGRYSSNSCILIPMSSTKDSSPIGVLCVTDSSSGDFDDEDYRLLITVSSQVVRGYEHITEIEVKKAFEQELDITSRIQQNILPSFIPEHKYLKLAARSVMARVTGGDFYDYFVHTPNGEVSLLVADVSGKSLPAALFMAICSSILRTFIRSEKTPADVLNRANDLIFEESESGMFVTAFLARYDPVSGILSYASAGHNEMLLMHLDGRHTLLSGKGPPLGVLPSRDVRYGSGQIEVEPGELLVLYTDGVIEAVDTDKKEYGLDNFIRLIRECRYLSPAEIIPVVFDRVTAFAGAELQYDDFTMLVTGFQEKALEPKRYLIALAAEPTAVPFLSRFVEQICLRHGIRDKNLYDILLVADELATNIVKHAYEGTEVTNPDFICELIVEADHYIKITFMDRGREFDLSTVKKPDPQENLNGSRKGGFGIFLIRRLVDRLEGFRKNGFNYLFAEKTMNR